MRIVLVVPAIFGKGVYWRAFHLGRELVSVGERVRLICHQTGIKNPHLVDVEGLEIVLLPTSRVFWEWVVWQVVNVLHNLRFALSFRPDVVHVFAMVAPSSALSTLGFRALRLWKRFETKVLVDWDDLWFDGRDGILRDYNFFIRATGKLLEEMSLTFGDATTVVSDYLAARAKSLRLRHVVKIPNGCDIDGIRPGDRIEGRKELGFPLDKPILVHIGFTDLTDMVDIVRSNAPAARLYVVGEAPKYVSRRIPRLKDCPGIFYTGSEPFERVKLYLQSADVLILKQENEATEMARWPIRFGDYLASGRPIATGKLGEVGRIVSEAKCGASVKPGNQRDLARAVLELLKEPGMGEIMGRNARAMAEQLSWADVANKLADVYSKPKL